MGLCNNNQICVKNNQEVFDIENVIGRVLRAENDYQIAINSAVEEAERHAEESKKKQSAHLDMLRNSFREFEAEQHDLFEKTLYEGMRKMDEENAVLKEQLKNCQVRKAELISNRLKKEVLELHGGH